jgi:hypothetical protein
LKYAAAHIKSIEIDKNRALTRSKGTRSMVISNKGRRDIDWWLHNIKGQSKPIDLGDSATVITTDTSLEGWGAQGPNQVTGGRWLPEEANDHINVLELKAILLGLESLVAVKG